MHSTTQTRMGDRAPWTSMYTTSRKSLAGIRSKPSPTLGWKARRQAWHELYFPPLMGIFIVDTEL